MKNKPHPLTDDEIHELSKHQMLQGTHEHQFTIPVEYTHFTAANLYPTDMKPTVKTLVTRLRCSVAGCTEEITR